MIPIRTDGRTPGADAAAQLGARLRPRDPAGHIGRSSAWAAGLLLDSWLQTRPIFTLIGMVLGIGAAMYTIWDVARDAMRR